MKIEFFHEMKLPTATAQTRRFSNGKTYLPAKTKLSKAIFIALMKRYAPQTPFCGPVSVDMCFTWQKPKSRSGKAKADKFPLIPGIAVTVESLECESYKTTRPDLDNYEKLIIDAGTQTGWWFDDAQIAKKTTAKFEG